MKPARICLCLLMSAVLSAAAANAADEDRAAESEPPEVVTDHDRYNDLMRRIRTHPKMKESRLESVTRRLRRALDDEDADDRRRDLERLARSYRTEVAFLARQHRVIRADITQFDDRTTGMLINTMLSETATGFDLLMRGSESRAAAAFRRAEDRRMSIERRLASAPVAPRPER